MNKAFYFNKLKKRKKNQNILDKKFLISPYDVQASQTVKENMKNLSAFQVLLMVGIKDFRWKGTKTSNLIFEA